MNYRWLSKKGLERDQNNDSALIVDTDCSFFAVLLDAAQRNERDNAFLHYFMREIRAEILTPEKPSETKDLIESLIRIQTGMRNQFMHNTASYLIVRLPKQDSGFPASVIQCGDCRLGIRKENTILWQTNVHTAANPDGSFFTTESANNPARHALTRSMNARRFLPPDVQYIDSKDVNAWLLCTDGYWADHLMANTSWELLADDASCLEISAHITDSSLESDADNLLCITC